MIAKLLSVAALAALAGCASVEPTPPEKIGVYESVVASPQVTAVVKRLWVDSWSSAFIVPSYSSAEDAASDFREHASRLGGNGVINFGCYRMGEAADAPLACNGTVVRFK